MMDMPLSEWANDDLPDIMTKRIRQQREEQLIEECRHIKSNIRSLLERLALASRVPLFLLGHFPTNECEISDFCL